MTVEFKMSKSERQEILAVLGELAPLSADFKKMYEKAKVASDPELFAIVNTLEDAALQGEQDHKKKAKTVADTLDIESALCDAAEKGDVGLMGYLIDKGIPVNDMGMFNTTPLFAAILKNQKLAVAFLLGHKDTDVNYVSGGGNTPLMAACRRGHEKIVNMLLSDPRIQINKKGPHGATALHNAAALGHEGIVKKLLSIPGIEFSAGYTDKNHSALSLAEKNRHPAVAQLIRDHQKIFIPPKKSTP